MAHIKHYQACSKSFHNPALLTIDIQNDTLDDEPFGIKGTCAIIPKVKKLLAAFRHASKPIIHIVRIYKKDGSNVDLCRREAFAHGRGVLLEGENGSQIVGELLPSGISGLDYKLLLSGGIQRIGPKEVIIYKSRWGAFYKTPLEKYLHDLGIETLVITGCNFPNCPRTTIYEASERDFKIVAIRDAISGIYERGISELQNIGIKVLDSTQFLSKFF